MVLNYMVQSCDSVLFVFEISGTCVNILGIYRTSHVLSGLPAQVVILVLSKRNKDVCKTASSMPIAVKVKMVSVRAECRCCFNAGGINIRTEILGCAPRRVSIFSV